MDIILKMFFNLIAVLVAVLANIFYFIANQFGKVGDLLKRCSLFLFNK